MGCDPAPLTLRELWIMAEEKQKAGWWHTANLMALMANINRSKGQRPYKPADFHPFDGGNAAKPGVKLTADNIEMLKVFV